MIPLRSQLERSLVALSLESELRVRWMTLHHQPVVPVALDDTLRTLAEKLAMELEEVRA